MREFQVFIVTKTEARPLEEIRKELTGQGFKETNQYPVALKAFDPNAVTVFYREGLVRQTQTPPTEASHLVHTDPRNGAVFGGGSSAQP
jgi:hypothetical protein